MNVSIETEKMKKTEIEENEIKRLYKNLNEQK